MMKSRYTSSELCQLLRHMESEDAVKFIDDHVNDIAAMNVHCRDVLWLFESRVSYQAADKLLAVCSLHRPSNTFELSNILRYMNHRTFNRFIDQNRHFLSTDKNKASIVKNITLFCSVNGLRLLNELHLRLIDMMSYDQVRAYITDVIEGVYQNEYVPSLYKHENIAIDMEDTEIGAVIAGQLGTLSNQLAITHNDELIKLQNDLSHKLKIGANAVSPRHASKVMAPVDMPSAMSCSDYQKAFVAIGAATLPLLCYISGWHESGSALVIDLCAGALLAAGAVYYANSRKPVSTFAQAVVTPDIQTNTAMPKPSLFERRSKLIALSKEKEFEKSSHLKKVL